jgi:predicted dehydrogenase
VVVATTNEHLAAIAGTAIASGKHVLIEKPAARSVAELDPVIEAAARHGRLVRVGFNHRYHAALQKASELFTAGALGEPMFLRARYGHGGRLGSETEWRADPALSGGGELIDQGVHLIDLARWFLGDFTTVIVSAHT